MGSRCSVMSNTNEDRHKNNIKDNFIIIYKITTVAYIEQLLLTFVHVVELNQILK